jgi:hypothetical protein
MRSATSSSRKIAKNQTDPDKGVSLLVGTRKGLWYLHSDPKRESWRLEGPQHLGQIINHVVRDTRPPGTMLMAAKTGHLGPTIFRSVDKGQELDRSQCPSRLCKGVWKTEARGQPYVLAFARSCERAWRVVGRHIPAGTVREHRRWRFVEERRRLQ